ncbi:MAG: tetratricopeptide repeat protein [Bacteroidia bacterium]
MAQTAKIQIGIVAAILALTVWLYLLPISKNTPETKSERPGGSGFQFEDVLAQTKKQYRPAQLMVINDLEKKIPTGNTDLAIFDSIGLAWDELKQPGIAAHYFEQKALKDNNEKSYINAAYRYFDAFKLTDDSALKSEMVNKAIVSYEKVISLNPKNLDAKTDLGVCYAEGTGTPMKGILMLREVISENPKHENAQLNLGFLSIKSQQFAKALERFDKVLEINPARNEVRIYKAQTYLQMGDTTKAKENLKEFISKEKDEKVKQDAESFLQSLN